MKTKRRLLKTAVLFSSILLIASHNLLAQANFGNKEQEDKMYGAGIHVGYSWLNGVVGAHVYVWNIEATVGWMPTKMPLTDEHISSIGWGITAYSAKWNKNALYVSFGQATKGYRYEHSTNGYLTASDIESMWIIMGGCRFCWGPLGLKAGIGYGWCDQADTVTGELVASYTFEL